MQRTWVQMRRGKAKEREKAKGEWDGMDGGTCPEGRGHLGGPFYIAVASRTAQRKGELILGRGAGARGRLTLLEFTHALLGHPLTSEPFSLLSLPLFSSTTTASTPTPPLPPCGLHEMPRFARMLPQSSSFSSSGS